MKSFKFGIVIALVFGCLTKNNAELGSSSKSEWIDSTITVNVDQDTAIADSIFIYEYFLSYDPLTHEYGDVDEPTVHDYWNKNNREALRYYKLASKSSDISAAQRLIFANYLLEAGMKGYVEDILSTLNKSL